MRNNDIEFKQIVEVGLRDKNLELPTETLEGFVAQAIAFLTSDQVVIVITLAASKISRHKKTTSEIDHSVILVDSGLLVVWILFGEIVIEPLESGMLFDKNRDQLAKQRGMLGDVRFFGRVVCGVTHLLVLLSL